MYNFEKWVTPLILNIICQQAIRLVTDIPIDNTFWVTPSQHLKELIVGIPFFYFFDWRIRVFLEKDRYDHTHWKTKVNEYLFWAIFFFIGIIICVFYIHRVLDLSDRFRDYVFAVMTCVPILLLYYTFRRNQVDKKRFDDQNLELQKIKASKLEADLKFLKAQYHPHFLFNALNTVYFLVDEKNVSAKESLELLSTLLRYQLYDADELVTLEDELHFLRVYVSFQKLRIDEGTIVNTTIETQNNNVKMHSLLFQPLLENAFKYVDGDLHIDIQLTQQDDMIIFRVENSIIPDCSDFTKGKGIGIANLRQRLSILYPNKHILTIEMKDNKFQAILSIDTKVI